MAVLEKNLIVDTDIYQPEDNYPQYRPSGRNAVVKGPPSGAGWGAGKYLVIESFESVGTYPNRQQELGIWYSTDKVNWTREVIDSKTFLTYKVGGTFYYQNIPILANPWGYSYIVVDSTGKVYVFVVEQNFVKIEWSYLEEIRTGDIRWVGDYAYTATADFTTGSFPEEVSFGYWVQTDPQPTPSYKIVAYVKSGDTWEKIQSDSFECLISLYISEEININCACDKDDVIHVNWSYSNNNYPNEPIFHAYYATVSGGSFSVEEVSYYGELQVDSDSVPHILYTPGATVEDEGLNTWRAELRLAKKAEGVWSDELLFFKIQNYPYFDDIAFSIDTNGYFHAIWSWYDEENDLTDIYHSVLSGVSWSEPQKIYYKDHDGWVDGSYWQNSVTTNSLALDSDGTVYLMLCGEDTSVDSDFEFIRIMAWRNGTGWSDVYDVIDNSDTFDDSYLEQESLVSQLYPVSARTHGFAEFVHYLSSYGETTADEYFFDRFDTSVITWGGGFMGKKVKITAPNHGFEDGTIVRIKKVVGMTEVNYHTYMVAEKATNTFVLKTVAGAYVDGSAYHAYISGGKVEKLTRNVSGAGHLEGEMVGVVADGLYLGEMLVTNGEIPQLANYAGYVQVGLRYRGLIKSMNVETPGQIGPVSAKPKNTNKIGIRVLNTVALKYGTSPYRLQEIDVSQIDDITGRPPVPFSGSLQPLSNEDETDTEKHVYLIQDKPLPCTILNVDPFVDVDSL